ncbi:hypothetical protein PLANTIT3_80097 [Plantibacter sp. T3]|nr:hypothetical protein PLANTIT3_80097 [Plantibacter sp. T3]
MLVCGHSAPINAHSGQLEKRPQGSGLARKIAFGLRHYFAKGSAGNLQNKKQIFAGRADVDPTLGDEHFFERHQPRFLLSCPHAPTTGRTRLRQIAAT